LSAREEAMASHPAGKGRVAEEPVDETLEPEPWLLDARDRCDACTAQAYVRVYLESGTLDFCGHHYNKFENKLTALEVRDEREKLNE
jgi:hypothetical protein